MNGGDDVQPKWISRCFDSVYTTAISEKAVYIGGHFAWNESPSAPDPFPGAADVGYGTGQGLSGYGLGDSVVNREHLGALDPDDGKALEWNPGSNSNEGNTAMALTPRGLITGGDATTQGGLNVGRLAFFDFDSAAAAERHHDHDHHADLRPRGRRRRAVHPRRARRPPTTASARSPSSSRTATPASGCRTTCTPGAAPQHHRRHPGLAAGLARTATGR